MDETKITPNDIDFELGEEIKGKVSFSTKMVNEPPERFITFNGNTKRSLCWGRIVPNETSSVLNHTRTLVSGKELTSIIIYLNVPLDFVEYLWNSSKIKELSSYVISFDYFGERYLYDDDETSYDILKIVYEKSKSVLSQITVFDNDIYQRNENLFNISYNPDKTEYIHLNYNVIPTSDFRQDVI